MRILHIVTISTSTRFFRGMLGFLNRRGFETALCSSPGRELKEVAEADGCEVFEIPIEREISPARDLIAVGRLCGLIRKYRPTIVNASTPKAGLLGMVAARLTRVPVRVYVLRGLRLETARGPKAILLRAAERIASACATRVFCVSPSLRRVYIERRLGPADKAVVLGCGSSNGVDSRRFHRDAATVDEARRMRACFGWPENTPVVGFVGRMTRDKGIVDLVEAFQQVLVVFPEARLLLVGDFESGDPVPDDDVQWLQNHPHVAISGFVADAKPYYALMDVLAFPSHREGFPNAPLEAAAMELPVVTTLASGCVDSVRDGVTGTLVPPGDAKALGEAITRYLKDPGLRERHGRAGRERVLREFRPDVIWEAVYQEYVNLLRENDLMAPIAARTSSGSREAA